MKKLNLRKVVGVLGVAALLLSVGVLSRAMAKKPIQESVLSEQTNEKEKSVEEKRKTKTITFTSQNGQYVVRVEYEDWNSWCRGDGTAKYVIKNRKGTILNKFVGLAPIYVLMTNNGKRIIAYLGHWCADDAMVRKIAFYKSNGTLIKQYEAKCEGLGGTALTRLSKLSPDNNYFAICHYDVNYKHFLSLFNVKTGKREWKIPMEFHFGEMSISNNARWIVVTEYWREESHYKVILIDKKGRKCWEDISKFPIRIIAISPGGETFKLTVKKQVEGKLVTRKRIYRNIGGKVELIREQKW